MKIDTKEARKHLPPEGTALNPFDGRYHKVGEILADYFSEYALMGNRCWVMIKYVIQFLKTTRESTEVISALEELAKGYDWRWYVAIKDREAKINHDVKACEESIAQIFKEHGLEELIPAIHIGCTSEDVNNLAYANMWRDALRDVIIPAEEELIDFLADMAYKYRDVPMMGFTHGQPAIPTTVGKELAIFVSRLGATYRDLKFISITGKLNGAIGNYSAMSLTFPDYDWEKFSRTFVCEEMNLEFERFTPQIDPHDWMVKICQNLQLFAMQLKKLDVDMWTYISKEMFAQIPVKGEVGSSTMSQKVNPIRFENSEGLIKYFLGALDGFMKGLMESRLDRDLSDSPLQRFSGELFSLLYQAINSTMGGLRRVTPNTTVLNQQLENNWGVLAEPIQTMLRKYGDPQAYNKLKDLTRGRRVTRVDIHEFIMDCDVLSEEDKERLLDLTPQKYIGKAVELTVAAVEEWNEMK